MAYGNNIYENIRPVGTMAVDPGDYTFGFGVGHTGNLRCETLVANEAPMCGNSIVEAGEGCDGDCLSECEGPDPTLVTGCGQPQLLGSDETCNARCDWRSVIQSCNPGDGCCNRVACDEGLDSDCAINPDPPNPEPSDETPLPDHPNPNPADETPSSKPETSSSDKTPARELDGRPRSR